MTFGSDSPQDLFDLAPVGGSPDVHLFAGGAEQLVPDFLIGGRVFTFQFQLSVHHAAGARENRGRGSPC